MQKGAILHWQEEDDDHIFVIPEMSVITGVTENCDSH